MIDETYAAFWPGTSESKKANLDRLRENTIGASSATWLRDVAKVLNRRFEPDDRDLALVLLAQSRVPARGVEAAHAVAHDPRRVPGARLPRALAVRPVGGWRPIRIRHDELTDYLRHRKRWRRRPSTSGRITVTARDSRTAEVATDFGLMPGKDQGVRQLPAPRAQLHLPALRHPRRTAQRGTDDHAPMTGACT